MKIISQEGREPVNFSKWGDYSIDKLSSLMKECVEETKENEMPLESYTLIHSKAKLISSSKRLLVDRLNVSEQSVETKK